ncbi:AMP-binding protein [Achromobacter insolitus]|uniref:AMP-binding protein n=1 Tax=Achromobacter insolitus TaxID=217204 RepID=UPI001FCA035B|nr:AMP-binding protein [Achromobacter insolitus]
MPKIIPRFQSEYLYNMRAVAAWNRYTCEDVLFFPTPYMHNLNMGCFFGPFLLSGAQVTVCRSLDEATLQGLVRTYRPTWFGVAGPILTRILPELNRAATAKKRAAASSLRAMRRVWPGLPDRRPFIFSA